VFTGADNTGRFSRIGRATWLQVYTLHEGRERCNQFSTDTFNRGTSVRNYVTTLASFVCAAYSPKRIYIKTISELRWHLFCKHMAESDKLPPTLGTLRQHVLKGHIQARVWAQASIALQDPQLDPMQNGYHKESDGQLKPTMTVPFQLHRPSLRWLAVIAKQTVLLPDVLAEHKTYPVPIFASAAVTVRMMRTHRADMKLMMTMMVMICKDSLVT